MRKSELIQHIKEGDKYFLDGNINDALISYLKPFKSNDEIKINSNSIRFKTMQERIISCFEVMVKKNIPFEPIHLQLIDFFY